MIFSANTTEDTSFLNCQQKTDDETEEKTLPLRKENKKTDSNEKYLNKLRNISSRCNKKTSKYNFC